jgi:hypothetical protein
MKYDYTGKFHMGQMVYLNDKSSLAHGRSGTITEINLNGKGYPYRVDFHVTHAYHPESELSPEPTKTPAQKAHTHITDIDSGLGIGGINNDQSTPTVPSLKAIERLQRLHDTDIICKRCSASANFDGAMFTTLVGTPICDDCA